MGILKDLPELEEWLPSVRRSWQRLSDDEYKRVVEDFQRRFSPAIERERYNSKGERAQKDLLERLPTDVILFSGLPIPTVGNMGGLFPTAYRARDLQEISPELFGKHELLLMCVELEWTCLFSHETGPGGWCAEQFYRR